MDSRHLAELYDAPPREREIAPEPAGRARPAEPAVDQTVSADAPAGVDPHGLVVVVVAGQAAGGGAVDEQRADARTVRQLARDARRP